MCKWKEILWIKDTVLVHIKFYLHSKRVLICIFSAYIYTTKCTIIKVYTSVWWAIPYTTVRLPGFPARKWCFTCPNAGNIEAVMSNAVWCQMWHLQRSSWITMPADGDFGVEEHTIRILFRSKLIYVLLALIGVPFWGLQIQHVFDAQNETDWCSALPDILHCQAKLCTPCVVSIGV